MQHMTHVERTAFVLAEAMLLIVRDRCDPKKVHQAMLGVEEYRDAMPADVRGSV